MVRGCKHETEHRPGLRCGTPALAPPPFDRYSAVNPATIHQSAAPDDVNEAHVSEVLERIGGVPTDREEGRAPLRIDSIHRMSRRAHHARVLKASVISPNTPGSGIGRPRARVRNVTTLPELCNRGTQALR